RIITNHSDGTLPLDRVKAAINPVDPHFGPTRLICLENTFNGRVLDPHYVKQASELARANKLLIHMDGARLFNAAVAQNVKVASLVEQVDSVQICFSKGLSAPVGSLVAGSKQFIKEARNSRKMVGGGMRQAGVIAAACLVALDTMVTRLKEDHDNAAVLAAGLSDLKGLVVDSAETNMVFASITTDQMSAAGLVERLAAEGVKVLATGENTIRIVTHYGIEAADITAAISAFHNVLNEPGRMQATAGRPG
ncbi:MAG TPA: GntG family PLP-dependent aldolase, partial [Chroococcales cyanobacterium]